MLHPLAPDVFLQRHSLSVAGCRLGRVVTVLRLGSGKTVIHSTAAFQDRDIEEIRQVGEAGWLVEASNLHDTFASEGRACFPEIPYLTPPGFKHAMRHGASVIGDTLPREWQGEIDVIEIRGMPRVREVALLHRASRTLVVADLLFNLPSDADRRTLRWMRLLAGIGPGPGMSRLFRFCIKDRSAFIDSMQRLLDLDFEKMVVAHGDPILDDPKTRLRDVLRKHQLVDSASLG